MRKKQLTEDEIALLKQRLRRILIHYTEETYPSRITSPKIAEYLNTDTRNVRAMLSAMRSDGEAFLFDSGGHYSGRVGVPEDCDACIKSVESRIWSLFRVRRGLRKAKRGLSRLKQGELSF